MHTSTHRHVVSLKFQSYDPEQQQWQQQSRWRRRQRSQQANAKRNGQQAKRTQGRKLTAVSINVQVIFMCDLCLCKLHSVTWPDSSSYVSARCVHHTRTHTHTHTRKIDLFLRTQVCVCACICDCWRSLLLPPNSLHSPFQLQFHIFWWGRTNQLN